MEFVEYIKYTLDNKEMSGPFVCPFCDHAVECVNDKNFDTCLGCNVSAYNFSVHT